MPYEKYLKVHPWFLFWVHLSYLIWETANRDHWDDAWSGAFQICKFCTRKHLIYTHRRGIWLAAKDASCKSIYTAKIELKYLRSFLLQYWPWCHLIFGFQTWTCLRDTKFFALQNKQKVYGSNLSRKCAHSLKSNDAFWRVGGNQ